MFLQEILSFIQNNIIFTTIFIFFIFLFFGSFLNVFLYRGNLKEKNNNLLMINDYLDEQKITKSEEFTSIIEKIKNTKLNLSFPSSHCPHCKNSLKWWHNIPILSFIILKGKCYFCKEKISIQYPIVEFSTAIVLTIGWVGLLNLFPGPIVFIYMTAFIITWMMLLFDYKYFIIPDNLNYSLLWLGLIASVLPFNEIVANNAIIGAVSGFMSLFIIAKIGKLIKGVDAMGDGDLKLLAGLGAFGGAMSIIPTIAISSFVGILTFIVFKYIHKNSDTEKSNMIPYGPSLIIAFWIFIFYKENILNFLKI